MFETLNISLYPLSSCLNSLWEVGSKWGVLFPLLLATIKLLASLWQSSKLWIVKWPYRSGALHPVVVSIKSVLVIHTTPLVTVSHWRLYYSVLRFPEGLRSFVFWAPKVRSVDIEVSWTGLPLRPLIDFLAAWLEVAKIHWLSQLRSSCLACETAWESIPECNPDVMFVLSLLPVFKLLLRCIPPGD